MSFTRALHRTSKIWHNIEKRNIKDKKMEVKAWLNGLVTPFGQALRALALTCDDLHSV